MLCCNVSSHCHAGLASSQAEDARGAVQQMRGCHEVRSCERRLVAGRRTAILAAVRGSC
jgi:hypothetical protein